MPAILLGQDDIKENPKPLAEEEEVEADPTTHVAAFMILIDKDGNYIFEPDINKPVIPARKPTGSEVKGALSAILMDISTQETALLSAQATMNGQMQMMAQMRDQRDSQKVLQQIGSVR